MNCINHNHLMAVGICVSCKNPYCYECLVNYGGELHCRYCLSCMQPIQGPQKISQQNQFQPKHKKTSTTSKENAVAGIIIFIVIIILMRGFIFSTDGDGDSPKRSREHYNKMQALAEEEYKSQAQKENQPVHDSMNGFEVKDLKCQSNEYSGSVTGKILNNKGYKLRYMQITINLFDKNGNIIGTTMDNVTNVGPGETWSFEAAFFDDNVNSVRVTEVIGN